MAIIYGIDTDRPITALMVRDALVECFYEAHCQDTGFDSPDENSNRSYCAALVKKAFADSGSNFEHPTKEDIIRAMGQLMEFAKNFRDPSIVQAHAKEIQLLLEKVK
jgi:hypothetical protein